MQQTVNTLKSCGATLVALTPQLPEHSRGMVEKWKLDFPVLSDPGNAYTDRLGLRFTLPADLREVYLAINIDLARHNGEDSWTLAVPARLVVGRDGIVRVADIDPDYTRRPEPEKTLADVAALD